MISIVIGGSGSGKSEYAENLLKNHKGKKYYLATMKVYDDEGRKKVERHQRLRKDKGFITIEKTTDAGSATDEIEGENVAVLLECMSNLIANEMFQEDKMDSIEAVEGRVLSAIERLDAKTEHLVIVTNNVNEDGLEYDESTILYMRALSDINVKLSEMADTVTEVVVGIPLKLK